MHFSKSYSELLLTLPPELRENAMQYRQLKKLINQVVNELASLGLSPEVLQEVLDQGKIKVGPPELVGIPIPGSTNSEELPGRAPFPKVVYEFTGTDSPIEPHLRLWVKGGYRGLSPHADRYVSHSLRSAGSSETVGSLESMTHLTSPNVISGSTENTEAHELIIPLVSDSAFFQLLSTALQTLSAHLAAVNTSFTTTLTCLSNDIALTARPMSFISSSFQPHSSTSNAAMISISSSLFAAHSKSDLYAWREIFQDYIDAQVFENVGEVHRGERTVEDAEARLQAFVGRVTTAGLAKKLKLQQSHGALEKFMELNMFILHIKKFQYATNEATRKILKKHAKRTALPFPTAYPDSSSILALIPNASSTSLPRVLVQAIGETLLPIIPHVDDYACLICTSIAFKPIRLFCGHLFCVRCLVKMQKRGKASCPMCRAPSVLKADRSNVDWALLNFMADWFPIEAKEKLKNNQREAAKEQMEELGYDTKGCVIA